MKKEYRFETQVHNNQTIHGQYTKINETHRTFYQIPDPPIAFGKLNGETFVNGVSVNKFSMSPDCFSFDEVDTTADLKITDIDRVNRRYGSCCDGSVSVHHVKGGCNASIGPDEWNQGFVFYWNHFPGETKVVVNYESGLKQKELINT